MNISSVKWLVEALQGVDGQLVDLKEPAQVINTAGNVVYSASQLLSCIVLRDPNGSARSDTLPSASEIISSLKNPKVGSNFLAIIRNTADAAETITLGAGAGMTISGTATIAQSNTKILLVVVTSSTTVTVYSIGTLVH
jgi:hypothetical protein